MKINYSHLFAMVCTLFLTTFAFAVDDTGQTPTTNQNQTQDPDIAVWPKSVTVNGQQVTFYQPQIQQFSGHKLNFLMAVGLGQNQQMTYGTVTASCNTDINQTDNIATCESTTVSSADFPAAQNKQDTTQLITQALNQQPIQLSVEQLESSLQLAQVNQLKTKNTQLQYTPPQIYVANSPTVLVLIDGSPQLRNVPNSNLMRIINTAFVVLLDNDSKTYYLQAGNYWMQAGQLQGPWIQATNVPQSIEKLEEDPATYSTDSPKSFTSPPNIIVSTQTAALLQVYGQPQFTPIPSTQLMYISNSDNNVFYQIKTQQYFILLSGRWYTSPNLTTNGQWAVVDPSNLPSDFASIPEDSPKAEALASVPNTTAALEANIRNQIPQTAKVDRKTAKLDVTYDGTPQFKSIPGTDMKYAVNTSYSVILLNGNYYVCYQGVWFIGNAPTGPWAILTQVPEEIYSIPPSVPVYPVTYTYIYDYTPDYVYIGYTGGYLNSYYVNGIVVYGTGYRYEPWIGTVYYGAPLTFGFNFAYWGAYGYWAAHVPYYSPWWYGGGLRFGGYYGPIGWHSGWWGPAGGGVFINHVNINTWNFNHYNFNNNHFNFNNPHNIYNHWGNKVVVNNWNQDKFKNFDNRFPNARDKFPNAGNQFRNDYNRNQNLQNRYPNAGNQLRDKQGNLPNAGNQRQNLQDKRPNAGDQRQNLQDKRPNAGDQLQNLQNKNPNVGNKNLDGSKVQKPRQNINQNKGTQQQRDTRQGANQVYGDQKGNVYQHNSQQGWQSYDHSKGQWQNVPKQQIPSNIDREQTQRSRGMQQQQMRSAPSREMRGGGGGGERVRR